MKVYDNGLRTIIVALYIVIILVVTAGVVFRYALNSPLVWSDTLSRWLFVWMVMLGASVAVQRQEHIAIDVLYAKSPRALARVLRFFYFASFVVIAFLLVRSGMGLVEVGGSRRGTAVNLPMSVTMYAIPVGAALICLEGARALVKEILRFARRYTDAHEAESMDG